MSYFDPKALKAKEIHLQGKGSNSYSFEYVFCEKVKTDPTAYGMLMCSRPKIKGSTKHRKNKDEVYSHYMKDLLQKHDIHGSYVGLAAAYAPEIYLTLEDYINGKFVSIEHNRTAHKQATEFNKLIFEGTPTEIENVYGDFLTFVKETPEKFAIVDFDGMSHLYPTDAVECASALSRCINDKALLAIWSSYGNGFFQETFDEKSRPVLLASLEMCGLEVVDYQPLKYRDSRIPMKVELIVVKRAA